MPCTVMFIETESINFFFFLVGCEKELRFCIGFLTKQTPPLKILKSSPSETELKKWEEILNKSWQCQLLAQTQE